MTNFQEGNNKKKPETRLESDGDGTGSGGRKKAAVGTGDDSSGNKDWKSRLDLLTATQPQIVGSVAAAHDGSLLASTFANEKYAESMGVWALGISSNTAVTAARMEHSQLRQIIARTAQGYVIIADVDAGVLAIVIDDAPVDSLAKLVQSIISTAAA